MLPLLICLAALVGAASPAAAACPSSAADLSRAVDAALNAAAQDPLLVQGALEDIRRDVACLSEVPSPKTASGLHLLVALDSLVRDERSRAVSAFRGMIGAGSPELPDGAAGQDGARDAMEEARLLGPGRSRPVSGGWAVDGVRGVEAIPVDRDALVQLADEAGRLWTWHVTGGSLEPHLAFMGSTMAERPEPRPVVTPDCHTSRWLAGGAGVAAAGAVGAFMGARQWNAARDSLDDRDSVDVYHEVVKLYHYSGQGMAALSGGLLVAAVLTGRW